MVCLCICLFWSELIHVPLKCFSIIQLTRHLMEERHSDPVFKIQIFLNFFISHDNCQNAQVF